MHIPDGILPTSVCLAGYATTGVATWVSLRKINQKENPRESIPKASLLTAAFFVASWIHIPVPPTSVHLVLNGLLGVVLGYYAFPGCFDRLVLPGGDVSARRIDNFGCQCYHDGRAALLAYYLFRLRNKFPEDSKIATGLMGFFGGAAGTAFLRLWLWCS